MTTHLLTKELHETSYNKNVSMYATSMCERVQKVKAENS